MKKAMFIGIFILFGGILFAQNEVEKEKSFAKVSVKYSNDYVFMGRTDSLSAPYITPSFTYFHKSGFFAKGSFSYLTSSSQNRVDLSIISVGYDAIGPHFYGGGSISTYFFNKDSYAVPSAMVGFLDAYVGCDFNILDVGADASFGLSEKIDVFAGLEVSRTFYLFSNTLLITPSFYTNAGSQNYYNEYYSTRSSKITLAGGYGKGQGTGSSGAVVPPTNKNAQVTVEEASKFLFLDYEFGTSVTYKVNNWRINLHPKYIIPINPSTVTVDDIIFEEALQNVFFWSASLSFLLH